MWNYNNLHNTNNNNRNNYSRCGSVIWRINSAKSSWWHDNARRRQWSRVARVAERACVSSVRLLFIVVCVRCRIDRRRGCYWWRGKWEIDWWTIGINSKIFETIAVVWKKQMIRFFLKKKEQNILVFTIYW